MLHHFNSIQKDLKNYLFFHDCSWLSSKIVTCLQLLQVFNAMIFQSLFLLNQANWLCNTLDTIIENNFWELCLMTVLKNSFCIQFCIDFFILFLTSCFATTTWSLTKRKIFVYFLDSPMLFKWKSVRKIAQISSLFSF